MGEKLSFTGFVPQAVLTRAQVCCSLLQEQNLVLNVTVLRNEPERGGGEG